MHDGTQERHETRQLMQDGFRGYRKWMLSKTNMMAGTGDGCLRRID
jgi:hypothetical protein